MRDRSDWHRGLTGPLREVWPAESAFRPGELLDVELGLHLLLSVMPARAAADAWTLFSGYPFGEAFGDVRTSEQRLRIQRARHYLLNLRRRREWLLALEAYVRVPQELRGFDLTSADCVPVRRAPARAPRRFERYEEVLATPPPYARQRLPLAQAGEYVFPVRDRRYAVTFTEDLLPTVKTAAHDIDALPAGEGEALDVTWADLERAAHRMDEIEAGQEGMPPSHWAARLARVELLVRNEAEGAFTASGTLRIDGLLNLVGMVGAGKSTLRDILTFWAVKERGLRITVVVGDVAETLAVTGLLTRLGVHAAPVLGQSTRERHIQRLHRRIASTGAPNLLTHQHDGFAYVNSACPLDALRGLEAERPLRVGEAPCGNLYSVRREPAASSTTTTIFGGEDETGEPTNISDPQPELAERPQRHGCPLWARCPRHRAARELVQASVWVATPASLVHSSVPEQLQEERLRYLELACRMSDLVVIDEADRVQMQLDTAFAPATTLAGRAPNSWIDEVAGHALTELARQARLQLSARDVDDWTNAVNTVRVATDRLYARLIQNRPLRRWITQDYFSALTLHQWLINTWFPDLKDIDPGTASETGRAERADRERQRARIDRILDRFRDDPLQPQPATGGTEEGNENTREETEVVNELVHLTLGLLHAPHGSVTRSRVRAVLKRLVNGAVDLDEDAHPHVSRFEFTLVLAALHHRLNFMTGLWQRVEAALNLDAASNVLSRRPPRDYEPLIPESPMGNVLGFQFQIDERRKEGEQSGELRFFRCNGVGRELLLALPDLTVVDGRPGPHVLLMSATSWAGTSSRYHVHADVDAVLRPHPDEVEAILRTEFRKEFLYWPGGTTPIRLSGCDPEERPQALVQMLHQLAEPDRSLTDAISSLQQELDDIDDPERRRILLLVGSYEEAGKAAEYLNSIPEWTGRVSRLVSDDADLDTAWTAMPRSAEARPLRRGDVAGYARAGQADGEILLAPLLAVERGHNIVLPGGKAAIGTVYFLARPHPRPDDIALAVQAINDWAVRQVRGPERAFHQAALAAGTPDRAGLAFRRAARQKWNRFLTRRLSWTSLPKQEKEAFTWDQLVVMWQVIGRLVRGGVPARAVFVDAAFSPREAGLQSTDTPATSLLASMRELLAPYFSSHSPVPGLDKSLVAALYEPLYQALADMD
ncbi:signal recognition particle [Streptomyces sp. NPDC048663]|uniref:pPIWI_RE_Z domain-containing protein n=1 Tax=Streptomyces sp. NPDC048663 TaxID=3155638 RepID=UPI003445CE3B